MVAVSLTQLTAFEYGSGSGNKEYDIAWPVKIKGQAWQCPVTLVGDIVMKAENYEQLGKADILAQFFLNEKRYELIKTAEKIDNYDNLNVFKPLSQKYLDIAEKIASDLCAPDKEITRDENGYKFTSKLSPDEVYQKLEEYFK